MTKKKEIQTGVVGLIAVILGVICRSYVSFINPPEGGLFGAEPVHIYVGVGGAVLLLVGGVVSIIGAAKHSGRIPGLVGMLLAGTFLILMLVLIIS